MKDLTALALSLTAIVLLMWIAAWVTIEGYWWFGLIIVAMTGAIKIRID